MGFEALCIAAWLMAQKQLEERMMSSEKEIMDLKEILPKLKKSANSKKEDIDQAGYPVRLVKVHVTGSLGARLIRTMQDGTYAEYLKKFFNYSAPLLEMAESVLMDALLTGLARELKAKVNGELMLFITNKEEDLEKEPTTETGKTETVELKVMEVGDKMKIALRTLLGASRRKEPSN
ncbi:retrotransposon protein [Cucumis melo var. makuwa]|uniref:Retrotransposon protein n=1 Tax=Cucumis melo var. makuwa TaxID=1194695 RepID=A0A5D3BZ79_CUCMM|nr:retrotransposon protein [Cucumis melo var. makuwa]